VASSPDIISSALIFVFSGPPVLKFSPGSEPSKKLFSFALFINNFENLTYLIGLVYNYAIMRKHFSEYKMRLYIDFHSVFGSPETFNVFNMFMDIINKIDPHNTIQAIVFFINPFHNVNNENIFDMMVTDLDKVLKNILFLGK
jgi:hypothetical protein